MTAAANETESDPASNYDYDDEEFLESQYPEADQESTPSENGKGSNRKTLTIVLVSIAVILALAIGGGIWWFLDYTEDDGLIYDNVSVAGIDLSGLTPDEAKSALRTATSSTYTEQNLVINLPDTSLTLSPADTGARLNVDTLVDAAYAYGRSGNRWENTMAKADAAATSYELNLMDYLTLDTEYIRQAIDQLAQSTSSTLSQTSVSVTGEVPALDRTIAEATADTGVVHMTMTIVKGTPDRSLDTEALYEAILNAYTTNDFTAINFEYTILEPDAIDLQALYTQYCTEPVDAVLNESTYEVTPEVLGYGFNIEEAQALLDAAQPGESVTISFNFIDAAVTILSLDEYMFQDVLASYSSNHTNIANRTNNLVLACKAIDGTIIRPGETFSFNKIVGERTAEKGYKAATVYTAGKSEPQLGGGICQVASTIYYCTLMADLEIVERGPHQFMVDYVPKGMDATIYWGSKDFKFKNNTNYPIRIDASTHGGKCHITLNGTDDKDYYIEMTYKTVSGPINEKTQYVPFTKDKNPNGYKDGEVIQTAYAGYTIETYKNKYSKETKELISTELEATSKFNSRPKIVAKLEKTEEPTKPTEPPATQPPETTPPATEPPVTDPPATEPTATDPVPSES